MIELLFRHFFCEVEGPSKSPDKLSTDAVFNLIGSINNSIEDLSILENFTPLQCPQTAKNIIADLINKHQSGEIELRDDRACFFAYAAVAIGLNLP